MTKGIVKEGPSVAEALDAALEEMGVQQDSVEYEVLEEGGRGFFGAGKPASVRVWLKPGAIAPPIEDEEDEDSEAPMLVEEEEPLTDEELDRIADEAVNIINSVLATSVLNPR